MALILFLAQSPLLVVVVVITRAVLLVALVAVVDIVLHQVPAAQEILQALLHHRVTMAVMEPGTPLLFVVAAVAVLLPLVLLVRQAVMAVLELHHLLLVHQ